MRESIKDKVAIVGMGCTQFGERWDADVEDLIKEATTEALDDAGIEIKDIQAGWVGTGRGSQQVPMGPPSAIIASSALQTQYIPFTRVENLCCAGQEALRAAAFGIASKCYDCVLAIGVEKLKDTGYGGLGEMYPGKWEPLYGAL
ncbi:MAG: acetyl-CoA acetyltransferase, partial [Dehalococcoidia bacterium]